jgi:hypothetical protein
MKTIEQLSIPKQVDSNFPFGAIINETDTVDGTPVVREIYNDHLVNHYKLLEEVGIVANGTEDNETNGYQILEALKKLPNTLNDVERVLSLSTTVWSVPFDLDLLPNKYFCVARASEDYVAGTSYTFKGTTATEYGFSSSGFKSGDELLVIIDSSGVRAYSLSFLSNTATEVFSVMGTPVAFNDTNKMWYQEAGVLMSDVPSVDYLESIIRVNLSNGTVLLNDVFVMNGYILCFCLIPSTNNYFFRQFLLNDLSVSTAVSLVGTSFASASDFYPYAYAQSGSVFITNNMNVNANDYSVSKLNYTPLTGLLTFVSTTNLDVSFVKTSNSVIKTGLLYTMISGALNSFNLTSGAKISLGTYSGVAGQLFGFNGQVYFSSGEVCKRWF